AEALLELVRALKLAGKLDQAFLLLDRAVSAARAAASPGLEAEALLEDAELNRRLGHEERARGRIADAVRLFENAIAAARAAGDLERALAFSERARAALSLTTSPGKEASASRVVVRVAAAEDARRAEARQKRDRALLETFFSVAHRLVHERDPEKVVSAVLDAAIEATKAERGFVLLSGDEDARSGAASSEAEALPSGLRVAAARNFDRASVRRPEFQVSSTVIRKAIAQAAPVLVRDALIEPDLADKSSVAECQVRSIVCVPFKSPRPRGVEGVLYLDNRFGESAFPEADLPAFVALAEHAAVAVENARLHAHAARDHRDLGEARSRAEDLARRLEVELARTGDELGRVRAQLDLTSSQLDARSRMGEIVGRSKSMQELYRLLERVKGSDVSVLIRGESGTGKELVARAIHFEGPRSKGPFVSESCSTIPETLVESTLFGHEPGSFTGATKRQLGLFEMANAGTLFLDEVGELTAGGQAKLLRVLEERRIRRIGGGDTIPVDVRVIAATHRDLEGMVKKGLFREDLYFRLNVVAVRLPSLRERRDDIPLLLDHVFARNLAQAGKTSAPRLSPEALRALLSYAWPGNVRELENEVKRILALKGEIVSREDLSPDVLRGSASPVPEAAAPESAPLTLEESERRALLAALRVAQGNKARAAEILAIPRTSLYYKLKHFGIEGGEP
ncbi:sigma-54-dependent Fis family transcriptional regulator, partial [bacterium]|nr:sigma-54-dependent Fis family transcriptional regulator [bacterium]